MSGAQDRIVIIGLSGRFPGARSVEEFWNNLVAGRESIARFSEAELIEAGVDPELVRDPHYVAARPSLEQATFFDAEFFGYSAREIERIDPQQRLFLECCWEALERAGYDPAATAGWIGVFGGSSINTYLLHQLGASRQHFDATDGLELVVASDKDYLATRVAYKLNLKGPAITVQTACSTGLVAVHQACQALVMGQCDMALAGAASIEFPQRAGYLYQPEGVRSPDGRCRPFDRDARGTMFGDAVGVVLLKRLDEALRDEDPIHAVVLGSAVNNDGARKVGFTAPSIDGQARAIALAQAAADVDPDSIGYLEAHGTGTSLGDPIEIAALTKAFRRATSRRGFCALGSVKGNVGHSNTAAGIVSLIKTVESLVHRQVPATLHLRTPNPKAELESSPFYLNRELRDWPESASPRRAGVSSFGLGGTNAHVILEEAPSLPARSPEPERDYILPLSARTRSALESAARRLAAHLQEHPALPLSDVAFTLAHGRRHFEQRTAVVCRNVAEASARLSELSAAGAVRATVAPRVVFLFTGQGSQYPGMGRALYASEPVFRDAIDRCAAGFRPLLGADVRESLLAEAGALLDREREESQAWLQPLLFSVEFALGELLRERGLTPDMVAGHSLGEIAAACRAGVFTLEQALEFVALRGRAIQRTCGATLAVTLDAAELEPRLPPGLSIAAINAPGTCAIAGPESDLMRFAAELQRRGTQVKRLKISCAAHSPLMQPAAEEIARRLASFELGAPRIPFVSTVTGLPVSAEEIAGAAYWTDQLLRPVRFSDALRALGDAPETVFVEVGPGRGLCTLVELHGPEWKGRAVPTLPSQKDETPAERVLLSAFAALWTRGVPVDLRRLGARRGRRVPLPTYPFDRKRHEAARPSSTPDSARADGFLPFERWFAVPGLTRSPRPRGASMLGARRSWLLLADTSSDLTQALERELRKHGQEVRCSADVADADEIVDLRALAPIGPETNADCPELFRLIELSRTLSELGGRRCRLHVVTSSAYRAALDDRVAPARTALAGACRALNHDLVGVTTRLVDVALPSNEGEVSALAKALFAELSCEDAEPCVALRGAERWIPKLDPVVVPEFGESRLAAGGVYVVTGGSTGIGRELVLHLHRKLQAKLVVISRSARAKSDLERLGADVAVLEADVADAEAVRRAFSEGARRFGHIDGIFHCAGVAGEGLIARKSRAQIAEVLAPKTRGTLNLHALGLEFGATFLVLFSSTLGLSGGPGQVDYAAANQFLAGFADATSAGRLEVVAIHWDIWNKIGIGARKGLVGPEALLEGRAWSGSGEHPLFDASEPLGAERTRFTKELDLSRDWVVSEHRILDYGVLPGTAFIAAALAAGSVQRAAPIELGNFELLEVCRVETGKPVKLVLEASAKELRFFADEGAQQPLARAEIAAMVPLGARVDLEALKARAIAQNPERLFEGVNESGVVRWGPRWQCLRELWLDGDVALGRIELDARFASEAEAYGVHPAALDVATAIAAYWADSGVYLPVRYRRIAFAGPLGSGFWSRVVRVPEAAPAPDIVCDVTLMDAEGRVLAEIEGFHLTFRAARPRRRLRGIEPELGIQALERILACSGLSEVVVAPRRHDTLLARLKSTPLAASTTAEASGADVAARLRKLWCELLGLEAPPSGATFFELGGHSLLALELQAKLLEGFGIKLPLKEFFKTPTLEALTARVASAAGSAELSRPNVLPRAPDRPAYPLTPAQRRLFFLHELEPESTKYNVPVVLRIKGAISEVRIRSALTALVERHESLRTSYQLDEQQPIQRVHERASLELVSRTLDPAELSAAIGASIVPFDLGRAPLFRAQALWCAPDDVALVLDVHHIAADGLSMKALGRELAALLREQALPLLATRYRDYVEWLERERERGAYEAQRRYWLEQFSGDLPRLELPLDAPRPKLPEWLAETRTFELDAQTTERLRRLAAEHEATPFALLLSLFGVLLGRWSGQEDVVIGTPVSGRRHSAVSDLVGMFATTLPLRLRPRLDQPFIELLKATRATALAAFDHQDYPFEDLVRDLALPRDVGQNPLFDVFFALLDAGFGDALGGSGALRLEAWMQPARHAKFDLLFQVIDSGATLACSFEYRKELFAAATIERLRDCFTTLLDAALDRPGAPIGELELAPAHERALILGDFNRTTAEFPGGTILDLFRARCEQEPDALAVSDDERSLSYRELDARSTEIAHALIARGVVRGDIVALLIERSVNLSIATFAVLKAGAAYLPLDVRYPDARLRLVLEDSAARLLVVGGTTRARAESLGFERPVVDVAEQAEAIRKLPSPIASDLAYVIYTSGSTGKPKGVAIEHGPLVNRLVWMQKHAPIGPGDVILQKTPYTFDVSVWELFWWSIAGAAAHFLEPGGERDPECITRAVRERGVTVMHFVPSMLGAFLEHVAGRGTARDFSGLRAVFASGEALSERHAVEFNRLLRPARLINLYGPTEATIDVSYYDVPERDVPGNVPIGRPIDNLELMIVGPSGKLQPIGVPGELWIAGVGLSRGYLNRPELTRERFVVHPCRRGERAYRTGDRARWLPNGEIEFLGRLDFQVKLRGHRIETGEIENAIRELPGVREAIVLLVGADSATPALAAYYVADREQSICEALAKTLPDYMVPSFVRRLDAFPVTANGKLDRAALPTPDRGAEKRELVLPATPDEHVIAAVWRGLLPGIEFGVTDDFFALGGDSIKAILLAARLQSRGFSFEVADVFRHPTIRALAPGHARRAHGTAAEYKQFSLLAPEDEARVLALGADGAIADAHPLLPQHEQVLAQNLVASRRGISVHRYEFDVEGELDVQALGAAWLAVLARHEILRSSFLWRRVTTPLALIHAEVDAPLAVHDLSDLDAAARRAAERALFESERAATRPDRPPLVRLVLAKLGPARSKLWLFVQNSLFDAWSAGNLRRDLLVAYGRIRSGRDAGLGSSVAFGSFVAWVRARDTSEAKRFWAQHLARAGAVSTETAPRSDRFEGAEVELALRAPATEALVRFARRHGMPLNVLAHAVWAVSFARRTAASDVIIGTVTSGRPAALAGVEDIVGLLATVLPVRIHLPADAAMRDWLEHVGAALLSVREHEHTDLQAIAAYSGADVRALQHVLHTRTLVFLNAPQANERLPASEGLRIEPSGVEAYVDVPLRAYVTPGEELRYKIRFDRSSVSESSVRAKLALILELLETLPRAERLADWLRPDRKLSREQEL